MLELLYYVVALVFFGILFAMSLIFIRYIKTLPKRKLAKKALSEMKCGDEYNPMEIYWGVSHKILKKECVIAAFKYKITHTKKDSVGELRESFSDLMEYIVLGLSKKEHDDIEFSISEREIIIGHVKETPVDIKKEVVVETEKEVVK